MLAAVVGAALAFAFTNGFRDTEDAVATPISTRALPPRAAIALAAVFNFAGALISLEVARTVAEELVDPERITQSVVLAGLVGALAWSFMTWRFALPSSSSHALLGGLIGAALAAFGGDGVFVGSVLGKIVVPAVLAPAAALALGLATLGFAYRMVARRKPRPVGRGFRRAQLLSSGMLALAHGANDAQKTIGVLVLGLIAHGSLAAEGFDIPAWVILASAGAIGLGTYAGGLWMIRTKAMRVHKMDSAQAFCAQGSGAGVALAATYLGLPISTKHATAAAVMGSGTRRRFSAGRWGVAGNTLVVWLITLPAAAAAGAAVHAMTRLL